MKVEYINPFIESIGAFFGKMLGCAAERRPAALTREIPRASELTALIGLAGPIRGMVMLVFPVPTALELAERLTQVPSKVVDDALLDAVGEAVNIVAGGAKAKLVGEDDTPITLSLPSVVRGSDYTVEVPGGEVWLDIPFTSAIGPFGLRVSLGTGAKGANR